MYAARDQLLGRQVAVKIIDKENMAADERERFLQEARAAAKLNHPNIVSIFDAGETDDIPFIVMELVEGTNLYSRKPTGLEEVVDFSAQLCRALDHAHRRGIVHRDLKPENIMLAHDGAVKLMDFGLALSVASRLTGDGIVLGTVFYLAPELVQGRQVDGRADLYALGVMMYEWSVGELPFKADNALAVISQHLNAPVVAPRARVASIPPGLDRLIVELLSKSPDARPGSAADVLTRLEDPKLLSQGIETPAPILDLERFGRGRMVGRDEDMRAARRAWTQALAGQCQALVISGESGIGKTRLVQEIAAQAEITRAQIYTGASYAGSAQPYAAFRQILRSILDDLLASDAQVPDQVLADLLPLAPEYRERFPDIEPSPGTETPADQARLFESYALLLASRIKERPGLLLLEDAQWADSGTLHLCRYLVRRSRQCRALFVLTHREVELQAAPVLHELLLDLQRERLAVFLRLLPLDRSQTDEMLENLFGEDVTPEFLDGIYQATEGNPFFVEELCKSLVESGHLIHQDGRWHRPEMKELGIPRTLRVAIQSRLRALPEDARLVLEAAAVRGRMFELEVVRRLVSLEADPLLDALSRAEKAQIIQAAPVEGRAGYSFSHSLIPAVIVEDLQPSHRRRIHEQIAPILEGMYPEEYELLAEHYRNGGQAERAIHYCLKAGDRARGLYALPEAGVWYDAALDLMKSSDRQEQRAQTLMKLGLVHTADFEAEQAQQAFKAAFALWDQQQAASGADGRYLGEGVLRFAVDEPLTLDPGRATDDVSMFIINQIFEGLVELDETFSVVPALAAGWDLSEDGRRYTIHLRQNLQWSDGSPLTAEDFEYAWKRNLKLAGESTTGPMLYVIEEARAFAEGELEDPDRVGVKALSESVLEVRLESPTAYFPQLLAQCVTYPLPRRAMVGDRLFWENPAQLVSNGRFQLAEFRPGKELVLAANPRYRGYRRGNVGRVECPIIRDYEELARLFETDALDGISLLGADPSTRAQLSARFRQESRPTAQLTTGYLSFLCDRPPLDDPRVRKAMVHAIHREDFVKAVSGGLYQPAHGGFLPPGMPGHTPGMGLAHDPSTSRRLLAEAGYPGGKGFPKTEFLYSSGSAESMHGVSGLCRAWERVLGIEVDGHSLEWREVLRRRDQNPAHIILSAWSADYPDPENMLRHVFHSTEGFNGRRWSNPEFDRLVEAASRLTDQKRRIELYQAADRILVSQDSAIMPLNYPQGRQLVKPWVRMPRITGLFLRLKHVEIAPRPISDTAKAKP